MRGRYSATSIEVHDSVQMYIISSTSEFYTEFRTGIGSGVICCGWIDMYWVVVF